MIQTKNTRILPTANRIKVKTNKLEQKRYLMDQVVVAAIAASPASMLSRSFGLLFFGLGVAFLGVVPFDGASFTTIAMPGDLEFFGNIFHNADETRGDISRNLIALQEMFTRDHAQLANLHDDFATAYPALIGDYEEIMRLLASVIEQIQLHANTGPMDIRLQDMPACDTVVAYLDDVSEILGHLIDRI